MCSLLAMPLSLCPAPFCQVMSAASAVAAPGSSGSTEAERTICFLKKREPNDKYAEVLIPALLHPSLEAVTSDRGVSTDV
jgi:hypothetical protein